MSTSASTASAPRSKTSASVIDAIGWPLPPYQRAVSIGSLGSAATNAAIAAKVVSGVVSFRC
jgi:hypothetical protein